MADAVPRYDFPAIFERLGPKAVTADAPGTWLPLSCQKPIPFCAQLQAFLQGSDGKVGQAPLKSQVGKYYDFYNDLVVRHLGEDLPVLRVFDRGRGWAQMSYDDLDARCTALAKHWAAQGVKAGAKVALLAPMGGPYLVGLMTALRLGATLCIVQPKGDAFVQHRVNAAKSAFVATTEEYRPLLGDFSKPVVPLGAGKDTGVRDSHSYKKGDPVFEAFSPLSPTQLLPVKLSAEALYHRNLITAAFGLGLEHKQSLAAPGFHEMQYQPSLTLASMVRAGCFCHIDLADAVENPSSLSQAGVGVLGVVSELRDSLTVNRVKPKWQAWFKSPAEPFDWHLWNAFAEAQWDSKIPAFNFVANSAAGGALLFSSRQSRLSQMGVLPLPGMPFSLTDVAGGAAATSGAGLFLSGKKESATALCGRFIVARGRGEYQLAASLPVGEAGRVYPALEVAALVEEHPWVLGATAIVGTVGDMINQIRITFIVFVDPERRAQLSDERASWTEAIREWIERRLGEEYVPDAIELFAQVPRWFEGRLDRDWCESQFTNGFLQTKDNDTFFQRLSQLKQIVRTQGELV